MDASILLWSPRKPRMADGVGTRHGPGSVRWYRTLSVLLVALLWAAAGERSLAASDLTEQQFRSEWLGTLQRLAPDAKATVKGPLEISVELPGGAQATIYLDNAYSTYRASPADKSELLEQYAASLVEQLRAYDTSTPGGGEVNIDPTRIIPVIKDRAWVVEMQQELQRQRADAATVEPLSLVSEPFSDTLVVVYAEDTPANTKYQLGDWLGPLGFDAGSRRAKAIANLHRLLPPVEKQAADGFGFFAAGGTYEPSLLLFDELWDPVALGVKGDIVVAVPVRDLLVFTGSADKKGLRKIRALVRDVMRDNPSYRLTDQLYVRKDGRFVEFRE